jgi:hypothetical protein
MSATPQPASNGKTIAGFIVMLIIIGSIIYSCSTSDAKGSDSTDTDTSDQSGMAELMCEDFVTDRLKAPSTADFPGADSVVPAGPDMWTVSASVDSENGFGAMIRTDYLCTVQDSGNDKWLLKSLDLGDE